MQCIGEAFGVDADDQAQKELYSTKPANLLSIFDVYLNTKKSTKVNSLEDQTTFCFCFYISDALFLVICCCFYCFYCFCSQG